MRLIDNIIITAGLVVALAGIGAVLAGLTPLWLAATVMGLAAAVEVTGRSAARDFPDGILAAIPDPEDILAMFDRKKD